MYDNVVCLSYMLAWHLGDHFSIHVLLNSTKFYNDTILTCYRTTALIYEYAHKLQFFVIYSLLGI